LARERTGTTTIITTITIIIIIADIEQTKGRPFGRPQFLWRGAAPRPGSDAPAYAVGRR
jgi:hypothetical protein